jgi:hypothetical protein
MAEQDAKQILQATLDRYGLGTLSNRVWSLYTDDTLAANSDIDTIGDSIRDTPEFAARFPANAQRVKAGLPELSVSEYIGLERGYKAAMQGSGLPSGFYDDPTDFANFIGSDTSVAEVQSRVNEGYRAVADANPQVIAQMKELYGVGDGELAAYFLDPQKATPLLVKQARAAQIASEGLRQAGITLTSQEAEALATEQITQSEAQTGFGNIAQQQELLGGLPGEQTNVTQRDLVASQFNTDQAAKQRVATRKRQRAAAFEGGGSFSTGQAGITGIA